MLDSAAFLGSCIQPKLSPIDTQMPAIADSGREYGKPKAPCTLLENLKSVSTDKLKHDKCDLAKPVVSTWPALSRIIAVLICIIAPIRCAPSASIVNTAGGTSLPATKLPKGTVRVNLGNRVVMVNHQAMGTAVTKATVRVMDETFSKLLATSTNINFDCCHQPLVTSSNRVITLGCITMSTAINDLSYIAGTDLYSWSPSYFSATSFPAVNFFGRSISDSSSFIYSLKNSTKAASSDTRVYKLDASVPNTMGSATMVTATVFATGPQGREISWLADPFIFIVYATATTFTQEGIAVIDKTSMSSVGTYPTAKINGIVERFRSSQNLFFIANENSATGYGFSKVLIGASPTFGVTVQGSWATGGSDIVTMWASPLMGIVYVHVAASTPANLVQLVNAYTMSTEGTLTFTETPVRYAPTLWSTTAGREYYLTVGTAAPGSASIFTRTMIWLDFCLSASQNPCVQCQAGRYLNNAATENLCITTADFPAGYGINGFYMGACLGDLAKGCLACPGSVAVCTICDNANGFYIDATTGQCYSFSTMPNGFGLNSVTKLVEACTTTNCQKCANDKTVCSFCTTGYYSIYGTTQPCYSGLSNFGLYYGSSAYYLAPCTALNCESCAMNASICAACQSLFTLTANRSCEGACEDSKCALCSSSVACQTCQAGMFLSDGGRCFAVAGKDGLTNLRLVRSPSINTETGYFNIKFDNSVVQVDFSALVTMQLSDNNDQPIDPSLFNLSLKLGSDGSIECLLTSTVVDIRQVSKLVLYHKNSRTPAFIGEHGYYPTSESIVVYAVYSKSLLQKTTQWVTSGITAAATAVAVGSGVGGANAAFFMKVIDSLEYILYMSGIRIHRADNFLHY